MKTDFRLPGNDAVREFAEKRAPDRIASEGQAELLVPFPRSPFGLFGSEPRANDIQCLVRRLALPEAEPGSNNAT